MWCKTSDLTKKKKAEGEEESRIFVLINVRRSIGNPCKRERARERGEKLERDRERATSPLWIED